jgi:hypothetical protein
MESPPYRGVAVEAEVIVRILGQPPAPIDLDSATSTGGKGRNN